MLQPIEILRSTRQIQIKRLLADSTLRVPGLEMHRHVRGLEGLARGLLQLVVGGQESMIGLAGRRVDSDHVDDPLCVGNRWFTRR